MEIGNKFGSWRVPPGGVKFNQKANGGSEAADVQKGFTIHKPDCNYESKVFLI